MNKEKIEILLVGDFCPIHRNEELAIKGDFESIFNDFTQVLGGNDLTIVDLECPLTLSCEARPKTGPHQKAHPKTINILKEAGVGLVAMANNHIMDYDKQGIEETLGLLTESDIGFVGVGKSIPEAGKPFTFEKKGRRIAILNYADNEFLTTPDESYYCNPIDSVQCYSDIADAKKLHDYIIVIMHAGNEFYELPSPRTKSLYRSIIEAGADAIVSHHTHVFSGYEEYKSNPIFYGLGNFLYDWPGKRNSDWNRGFAVKLSMSDKLSFQLIPFKQSNLEPGIFLLNQEELNCFNDDIGRLNEIIRDDKKLEHEFTQYCNSVSPMYDAFLEPNFGKYITALRKRGFFPKIISRRKRLLLLNLVRCESHREVLIRLLKQYQ